MNEGQETTKTVHLPSGNTWTLETDPEWGQVLRLREVMGGDNPDPNEALAILTVAWSFNQPISAKTVAKRKARDVIPVWQVFNREVVPLLVGLAETAREGQTS